uniref:HUN domain-containing protein n=1 Tax=Caenorhabditis japonica TaxID=281687 RepID=A0A8R1HWJ7_CAEJA
MNDEQLVAMVTAIYATGVPIVNQIVMLKNILAHVGQSRMAQSIVAQKSKTQQLSTKEYQLLFDYFQKYDKALDARKLRVKEAEEKEQKKAEERAKKEREKQLEKEKKEKEKEQERVRKEQEKVEERERKEREKREEKERKEREIREAADRKRREEEDRRLAIERIRIQQEDERRKREAQDAVQKELERRARMETEAANALQFLEEDNLMDDVDFVAEQQSRVDQERKKVEEKRAVERQNQIKMMRAKQLEREVVDVPRPTTSSQPEAHEVSRNGNSQQLLNSSEMAKTKFSQNSMDIPSTSTSSFPPAQPPLNQARNSSNFSQKIVKQEPNEHQFDILGAAQEAAGLTPEHSVKKEPVGSPAPGTPKSSAFDQLARLRGRTMSADVRRASEHSGGAQYQTNGNGVMVGQGAFNASSPLHHPPAQQQFFPQETMVVQQQNIPRMSSHHQNSPLNNVSNQMYFANGNGNAQHMQQHVEPSQQQQQQQNVNRRESSLKNRTATK